MIPPPDKTSTLLYIFEKEGLLKDIKLPDALAIEKYWNSPHRRSDNKPFSGQMRTSA